MFIQDADLEYDPNELSKLLDHLKTGRCDVIYGSRFRTKNPNLYWMYLFGNKVITFFINVIGEENSPIPIRATRVWKQRDGKRWS